MACGFGSLGFVDKRWKGRKKKESTFCCCTLKEKIDLGGRKKRRVWYRNRLWRSLWGFLRLRGISSGFIERMKSECAGGIRVLSVERVKYKGLVPFREI